MRLLCSSGSNNQRRMRREQSKTSHSGGEETKKQKGTARGRFSPERTHQNHRFPLGFFYVFTKLDVFVQERPRQKATPNKTKIEAQKWASGTSWEPPRAFWRATGSSKPWFLLRESIVFQKNEQNSAMHPKTQPENASRQSTTKLCSHNDKKSL